ncbi:MAG TPA: DNA recombination protein RmuC [Vicinamibacteria bacterium]|nr:DNA recombination protein RmuC [Vicinamibacteria bacterium]
MESVLLTVAAVGLLLGLLALGGALGALRAELQRLGRAQEELRRDVLGARDASLAQLHAATTGLRSELGAAQRSLAEVKAIETGRAAQLERAAEALRRLEAVLAGSATRGAAGEHILERALGQLPPDLLERNVAFGSRVVEYALRLPGGRLLPIDSKWGGAAALARLGGEEGPEERRRLAEQLGRELRGRVREVSKYLDPERTFGLAVLAVPDAVHSAAPEAHAEGWREGVLVVPYSLTLSYVLGLYRLALRLGAAADEDRRLERMSIVEEALHAMEDEVEGRLSRGLVQAQNARDLLRGRLSEARSAAAGLLRGAEAEALQTSGVD